MSLKSRVKALETASTPDAEDLFIIRQITPRAVNCGRQSA